MGKGDIKTKRGKITAGSYGKRRPRKASKPTFAVGGKLEKQSPKKEEAKETKKTSAVLTDRETVNFNEDHELNYHLKKNGLSQSKDNRAKLVDFGGELKKELDKKILTHEEVDALIEKNIGEFKALGKR